jgi:hypothetical protein
LIDRFGPWMGSERTSSLLESVNINDVAWSDPAMLVNETLHGDMTKEKVDELVKRGAFQKT